MEIKKVEIESTEKRYEVYETVSMPLESDGKIVKVLKKSREYSGEELDIEISQLETEITNLTAQKAKLESIKTGISNLEK